MTPTPSKESPEGRWGYMGHCISACPLVLWCVNCWGTQVLDPFRGPSACCTAPTIGGAAHL